MGRYTQHQHLLAKENNMNTTARDIFADQIASAGGFLNSLTHRNQLEAAQAGLEALCALWFDFNEDETELPSSLVRLIEEVQDVFVYGLSETLSAALDA